MAESSWVERNQSFLAVALRDVRRSLERRAAQGEESGGAHSLEAGGGLSPNAESGAAADGSRPALEVLVRTFGLSPFERSVLLLCAGMELDAAFAGLCAAAQGDSARAYPTFSLALAALDAPHWSAVNPGAALRHWRLIDVLNQGAAGVLASPLRIDERILHFLTGIQYTDERLAGVAYPMRGGEELPPSHAALASAIQASWSRPQRLPAVQLCGPDDASKRAIAVAACAEMGLPLFSIPAEHVPSGAAELDGLVRLWEREAMLTSSVLYLDADGVDRADARGVWHLMRFVERLHTPLIVSSQTPWRFAYPAAKTLEVRRPTVEEQRCTWQATLDRAGAEVNGQVQELASQFNLPAGAIQSSVADAMESAQQGRQFVESLWDATRAYARPRLDDLAQRIEAAAGWDDLVLPANERGILQQIAAQVSRRAIVYESWGFGRQSHRGLGISALFVGASGTGKTMAAEVLANTLRLDLYRIDLAGVVSKYIGETEKNLKRVFGAAEDGGAILFFDEADALFGKRSEVKDSHDRYANIEINYLLQRMESYRGLAVLATNMKSALDPAFMRRIRFVVNFPFPELAQRAQIWQRVFPAGTPTEGLNANRLARLAVTGGNIRNIALNAAFLAADQGTPVRMSHLADAARYEFAKLEKPLPEGDLGGWA